jgi:hypothetical protein
MGVTKEQAVRGRDHYAWKEDEALATTKRERARRMFPDLGPCEANCGADAVERHHIDGDTGNNVRSNLMFLCRRCHMIEDGRLDALRAVALANAARQRKPPRPCQNCGRIVKRLRTGARCGACAEYLRRNGRERPADIPFRASPALESEWQRRSRPVSVSS